MLGSKAGFSGSVMLMVNSVVISRLESGAGALMLKVFRNVPLLCDGLLVTVMMIVSFTLEYSSSARMFSVIVLLVLSAVKVAAPSLLSPVIV